MKGKSNNEIRWVCEDYMKWIKIWGTRCKYKEQGNMKCFRNVIIVFNFHHLSYYLWYSRMIISHP